MKIKNWNSFQHYKDRSPPWLKLHRRLIDDPKFLALSGDAVKCLVLMWIVAADGDERDGSLPDIDTLAFRLRISPGRLKRHVDELHHFLEQPASDMLAGCEQVARPETERERETKSESESETNARDGFDDFWEVYPRKASKKAAQKAWEKASRSRSWPGVDVIRDALSAAIDSDGWRRDNGQYIPHASTWLNGERWTDESSTDTRADEPSVLELFGLQPEETGPVTATIVGRQ